MPPKKARVDLCTPSASEWKAVVKHIQMDEKSLQIARAVFFDRRTQAEVAKEHEVTRQWVGYVVTRILKQLNVPSIPASWMTRTVTLPREDWMKVDAIVKAARAKLEKQARAVKHKPK